MLKDRLRTARQARGLTLTGLAARLSPAVTRCTVSHWEAGRYRPKRDNLIRLAAALGVGLEWLVGTGEGGGPDDGAMAAGSGGALRRDLLSRVEIALESYLQDNGLIMAPADRWEAVEAVYDWASDAERESGPDQPIRIDSIRAFLRRAQRRGANRP